MTSDRLFVYGTLMRGFDHPMAMLLSRAADFIGEARCRGRLYRVKHYPGLLLSDDADDVVFGELYRLRQPKELLREFDMYEACGEGFAEPTEYVRRMLPVMLGGGAGAAVIPGRCGASSPESILTMVVMDSGPAPRGASRNDRGSGSPCV